VDDSGPQVSIESRLLTATDDLRILQDSSPSNEEENQQSVPWVYYGLTAG
jgi:hypothetical protein